MENQQNGDDDFSPGERAYFQSGGQDTKALESELETLLKQPGQDADQADKITPDPAQTGQDADQKDLSAKPVVQDGGQDAPSTDQGKAEASKPGFVPVNALHEEREQVKALKAQLAKVQERFSRADERQKLINELLGIEGKGAQPKTEEQIDPEKDIFGAFKQLQTRFEQLASKGQEMDQRFARQTEAQQVREAYVADAKRFISTTPDFVDAYNHLLNVRDQELTALGIDNPGQRREIMVQEEGNIARQALSGGRSAAEVIYSLAKLRGFSPKPAAESAAPLAGQNDAAAAQLAAVQKGREAALSLSSTGSSSSSGLTAQQLADMNDDEFERAYNGLTESQRRKLMGG